MVKESIHQNQVQRMYTFLLHLYFLLPPVGILSSKDAIGQLKYTIFYNTPWSYQTPKSLSHTFLHKLHGRWYILSVSCLVNRLKCGAITLMNQLSTIHSFQLVPLLTESFTALMSLRCHMKEY